MMSRSKSATSLPMTGAGSWDWRSTSPAPSSKKDWRTAISTPINYRLGSSTVHFRPHLMLVVAVISCSVVFLLYATLSGRNKSPHSVIADIHQDHGHFHTNVIKKYPLTSPVRSSKGSTYKIAIVSDLDTDSKAGNKWISYLQYGELTASSDHTQFSFDLSSSSPVVLEGSLASGGRGMELSELSVFNGNLYTVDDRTGVVYQIVDNKVVPWVILTDGPGNVSKGFKAEWSTVKGEELWVGGLGKEWTSETGEFVNSFPMYVKVISPTGEVSHIDWKNEYLAVRESVGIQPPGYMIHEAVGWSEIRQKWVFLPRRASKDKYDDMVDEKKGTNLLITADENFERIEALQVGEVVPTHGFSTFKFLPGSKDEVIVALKSEENEGTIASYLLIFNIHGKILLPETKVGDKKFEGLEFV